MINGYFKFHSVGQGLFYEGNIELNNTTFRFVYDCGEQRGRGGLPKALHEYNLRNHDEYIDLLVLSHLDFDHFSGMPDLLNNHKVKMLVMPYYNLYDLFLLEEQVLNSALSDGEKHRILNFCSDPEGFLREHVSKVILMASEGEEIENREYERFDYNDLNWENISFSDFSIGVTKQKSFLLRVAKWEFIFHNRFADPADIKLYLDSLIKAAGSKDLPKNVMSDINELKKIVRHVKKSMPQKKSNNNSVILYHGPNINLPQHFIKECAGYYSYYYPFYITVDGFGTLLTGDIEDIENEWNCICSKLTRKRIANIGNFLVPHHGAKTNFTNFEFENCIISYGIRNTYRHPNPSTLHTIANSCTHLHLVNEYNSYSYRIIEIKLLRN